MDVSLGGVEKYHLTRFSPQSEGAGLFKYCRI